MFHEQFPIDRLYPAEYNPRILGEHEKLQLIESIKTLGLIKPIIATTKGIILAGHQRTSAAKEIGYTTIPTFLLNDLSQNDEIRFNQLHNMSDVEFADTDLTIPQQTKSGIFVTIHPNDIKGNLKTRQAARKKEILRLLTKYGEWGSAIALENGKVIVSQQYAISSKILNIPCRFYILPQSLKEKALFYFGQKYGKFTYEHLPKNTWVQSLAQMKRLRGSSIHSRTYENFVIPRLIESMRVLDFGAGYKDYAIMLQKKGFNVFPIEFYNHKGNFLLTNEGQNDITLLCQKLIMYGKFDMVVCDSVLNSVDSVQAESDVLTCLQAFCKKDGIIIFSGRTKENTQETEKHTRSTDNRRYLEFVDDDGISGMFNSGVWRYQKFHSFHDVDLLCKKRFSQYSLYDPISPKPLAQRKFHDTSWVVVAKNTSLPQKEIIIEALSREFNLPLPNNKRFGRSQDIIDAWQIAQEKEARHRNM